MDRETADLIVAEVTSLWPGVLDDLERARWYRMLRPAVGAPLDPELVGQALLHFRHASADRPSVGLFRSMYDAMSKRPLAAGRDHAAGSDVVAASLDDVPTDSATALGHIAGRRLILTGDVQAAEVVAMAGQS